jgi:hypothetical protein
MTTWGDRDTLDAGALLGADHVMIIPMITMD